MGRRARLCRCLRPKLITENGADTHCFPWPPGFRMRSVTDLSAMEPKGGCFAPVRICFAVIQYSRLSTSIEKIVPAKYFD